MIPLSRGRDEDESSELLERLEKMREMVVVMVAEGGEDKEEAKLESEEDFLERLGELAG